MNACPRCNLDYDQLANGCDDFMCPVEKTNQTEADNPQPVSPYLYFDDGDPHLITASV